jgi:glycosyltransferase involved in cell wall biosynthesis
VFQSLAVGAPVVTARTPAAEEFFTHRENIYFCDEPLAGSLALAILELKRDAALRDGIASAGARLIRERYSARTIGRRLLDILESRRRRRRV